MKFSPCTGNCTEEGTNCEGCGRSHEEIAEMNMLIANLMKILKILQMVLLEVLNTKWVKVINLLLD